jgi:hypothetical protein
MVGGYNHAQDGALGTSGNNEECCSDDLFQVAQSEDLGHEPSALFILGTSLKVPGCQEILKFFDRGPRISRCNEAHVEADTTLLITAPATTIVERVVSDICSLPGARRVHAITPEKRQMMPLKIRSCSRKRQLSKLKSLAYG